LPATGVTKILVRGRLAALGATVERGNHAVTVGGTTIPAVQAAELRLAHFPMRSGWQMLAKAFVGRLKVLAAGAAESERGSSSHYTEMLGNLRTHPEWLLSDGEFLAGSRRCHRPDRLSRGRTALYQPDRRAAPCGELGGRLCRASGAQLCKVFGPTRSEPRRTVACSRDAGVLTKVPPP
jgi:hypothetical protein